MPDKLIDKFGRVHDYLRISVTDRCNLRCVYCMPEDGMEFEREEHILSYEEIAKVVRVLAGMGVTKVRLTGGEPLVRKDLDQLIGQIADIPGIQDISLTTNGIFLAKKAEKLKAAGLYRLNISLDTLRPERFGLITRGGDVAKVLESVEACLRLGFEPIKLNVVLMKGVNDDEIWQFIELTERNPLHVRFIEYMPIGHEGDSWRNKYYPLNNILSQCEEKGWRFREETPAAGNGPARYYRVEGHQGTFGLIHPVSDHFCETCNRLRLTADGNIKPCLFWSDEFNVRKWIGDDEKIKELFLQALDIKPENHEMAKVLAKHEPQHAPTIRRMSQIGG
ncbi:molybdenum cofactor biosynthesis protein MoeA [Gordoniibacillus kamchatkensis]|uniref:GTP 3',8-cyclase n=1 Tax=Gordoniibacillus kamchatkensis TaxID=1590651 RepID=A0ABR5AKW3_9BACL|nr:GTP 3',8-cyclase MoaA [Paenibacillus sp. VKM B-2647]KIL41668.1 molybdenum cofactor biosynthesis protein MoeA [Paenibacillus sp. VKM B-2647]